MVVAAYAGMKGDSDKDRKLAEARAFVVREYLVKNFKLDDTRIKTIGLGKADAANQDRKLDILVYSETTAVPAPRAASVAH